MSLAFYCVLAPRGTRWPDDSEFNKAWAGLPMYERLVRPRLRFILRALEEHMRVTDGLTEPFDVPTRLEIEHVMPQAWEANWPLPVGESLNGGMADHRREIIHSIGNLTLVTKKLNGTLSNAPWSVDQSDVPCKRSTLEKYSLMMISKNIINQPNWNETQISDRGDALFNEARKIWPPPPSS